LEKDYDLPFGQTECLAGHTLLMRTLPENTELAKPRIQAGRMPPISVSADQ